jgi:hypothetical protein
MASGEPQAPAEPRKKKKSDSRADLLPCAQMPARPWKRFAVPAERREYVALATFLSLMSFWAMPRFGWFSLQVQRQLARSRGLIGYSLDSDIARLHFWTLSAWADRQSLSDFVHAVPHGKIMSKMAPFMAETKFVYWKVDGSEIPLRWDDAKARIESQRSH